MKIIDECIACGICAKKSPVGAIVEADGTCLMTRGCTGCVACVNSCPVAVITD